MNKDLPLPVCPCCGKPFTSEGKTAALGFLRYEDGCPSLIGRSGGPARGVAPEILGAAKNWMRSVLDAVRRQEELKKSNTIDPKMIKELRKEVPDPPVELSPEDDGTGTLHFSIPICGRRDCDDKMGSFIASFAFAFAGGCDNREWRFYAHKKK